MIHSNTFLYSEFRIFISVGSLKSSIKISSPHGQLIELTTNPSSLPSSLSYYWYCRTLESLWIDLENYTPLSYLPDLVFLNINSKFVGLKHTTTLSLSQC